MKYIVFLSLIVITVFSTSCLEMGLEEIENAHDAEIINIKFEHRWAEEIVQAEENANSQPLYQLAVVSLPVNIVSVSENNVIECEIIVPAAGSPGNFTTAEREKVTLSSIVGMATISTAATIEPIGDSPVLGKRGDFSKEVKYLVTAADGINKKEYTLACKLIK